MFWPSHDSVGPRPVSWWRTWKHKLVSAIGPVSSVSKGFTTRVRSSTMQHLWDLPLCSTFPPFTKAKLICLEHFMFPGSMLHLTFALRSVELCTRPRNDFQYRARLEIRWKLAHWAGEPGSVILLGNKVNFPHYETTYMLDRTVTKHGNPLSSRSTAVHS